jgi:predicted GTPase
VGKSSLFNRLVNSTRGKRKRAAIVSPYAGTTRDRLEAPATLAGFDFIAVDTGGLDLAGARDSANGALNAAVEAQVSGSFVREDAFNGAPLRAVK